MELASKYFLFATLIACSYAANDTGLTALTNYDCGCPGQNASYICTAVGGVITVWSGTAFNCPDRNEITLRHNQFENAMGDCNDGAVVGYSVESVDNCFTSRLDVRLSTNLQGRSVTCSVDDGSGVSILGTSAVIVSTVTPVSALPPPPRSISTLITNNNPGELIFRWNRVLDSEYNCSMLQYDFTSQNCGSCTEITPQVVSCSGFQTSSAGIICTFTVSSVVCGNITGPGSMQSASVNLKVPDAPTQVQSFPRYHDGRIQILIGLMTTFPIVAPTFITNGIDGSIQNYTITYTDTTFGSRCGTVTIPASACVGGTCTHNFDILQSSSCPASTTIIMRVVASNILGSSPPSTPVIKEGINNLVNVNFDLDQRRIMCTFINQLPNIVKRCSANITYGEDCDRFLGVFSGMGTEGTVATQPLESVIGVTEYCFLVTAEANNVTVIVDGTLLNIIDSQANVRAAIVVPLIFVLIVLTLLMVLVAVLVVKCLKVPESTADVVFSVADKPGSLAAALKIFKDCNVNILGLNTHLHHAKFDRNAGNGYKFNYVHCVCKEKGQKEFLETDLKAEIEGDGQGHVTTAIIKVKDSPGALWNAIHKIGNRGINIVGVNTLTKRDSIPGYKENHVKCYCSDEKLRRVRTQLIMLTGKEVNLTYLDNEDKGEEKAIQYLVKDEVGALANTLEVISEMGINISGVNPDHLPKDVRATRATKGSTLNFIECIIDENTKERLFHRLRTQYGAIDVKKHDAPPDKVDEDPDYTIVKVTIQNERGSLNRVLQGFHDLKINIHGVNILKTIFSREMEIPYKHYHLEISATNEQEMNLIKTLQAEGLAIDIKPFDLTEYLEADQAKEFQNRLQSPYESAETESNAESELDVTPTTRIIQFLVKNEAGTLANAIEKFSVLGINITGVNPVHLSLEHQEEFVECSCVKDQRQSLIRKLKSYGAMNADEVKQVKSADPNYCVVKFSVVREVGLFEKVLKAFSDMGVKILNINPATIKVRNQYVECCCTEDEQTTLLRKLMKVEGVTDVVIIPEPDSLVSVKPTDDPNYCIIKYTVDERAGTLVRALKIFFKLNINIIGVNTLNPAFDRTIPINFKHNHVVLVATEEEVKELKCKLLESGLAFDVRPYTIKHSSDSEALQPGNVDGNDIALTRV